MQLFRGKNAASATTRVGWRDQITGIEDWARAKYADFHYKITHLPQTNYELGLKFAQEGKFGDAIFRFRVTLYLAPEFADAWYHLGTSLIAKSKPREAITALKKCLHLKPEHEEARYMLAALDAAQLGPKGQPMHMPASMVEEFFARSAPSYDAVEAQLGYEAPQNLYKVTRALLPQGPWRIVDLGCGTGLSARPWRKEALQLVGVDRVTAMVERAVVAQAETGPLFNHVATADVAHPQFALAETQFADPYDLVLAVNLLPYIGEAGSFITNAARLTKPGGHFAVTLEPYNGTAGFGVMQATMRFGHHPDYIRLLAEKLGFALRQQETILMYPNVKLTAQVYSKMSGAA
jgi:predicted TPR repeat methyltransferase